VFVIIVPDVVPVPESRVTTSEALALVPIFNVYVVLAVPAMVNVLFVASLVNVMLLPCIKVKSSVPDWFAVKSLKVVVVDPIFDLIL